MSDLIFPIKLSPAARKMFEDVQWKAWSTAIKLNPKAERFGFNVNSTYQCEIYPEHDDSPKEEWDAGDLTWENFISEYPDYLLFVKEYNFYHGITMIGRAVEGPHRHGNGELTFTYPLVGCNGLGVHMVNPVNEADEEKWWLNNQESYTVKETHVCKDGYPFMIKANHFHKTDEPPIFQNGKTIITVWHSLLTKDPMHYLSVVRMMNLLEHYS